LSLHHLFIDDSMYGDDRRHFFWRRGFLKLNDPKVSFYCYLKLASTISALLFGVLSAFLLLRECAPLGTCRFFNRAQ
jgi:hypothetical protein